jgi:3-hydroxyacyl-[acyl-carrier-protein] dehydratase
MPALRYNLVDSVLEQAPDRIRTLKQVTAAEEYLADHFPGYPILPGVLMLEVFAQSARIMLEDAAGGAVVLGGVKALKYGAMVKPGEALEVEVLLLKGPDESGAWSCKGTGTVRGGSLDGETAVSGRFTMRPVSSGVCAGG